MIVINLVFIRLKGIVFFVKKSFITSDRCIELLNEKKKPKIIRNNFAIFGAIDLNFI